MHCSLITNFTRQFLIVCFVVLTVTACGGGGGSVDGATSSLTDQSAAEPVSISVAGIKGPLAFASVELYTLDMRFGELYDPQKPLAATTTNAFAAISGLQVPANAPPPYVLVIDGASATDLNTGVAPVLKKLVTIITQSSLDAGRPIYATPYTTLAYDMLAIDSAGSSGNGLQATYFNDTALSNIALKRVDGNIDFDWQKSSPDTGVNRNEFSVRWTGFIEPEYSEEYTFYTSTDDGVRLWIDGQLIVDRWKHQLETEDSGSINLTAGQRYAVKMEYYDQGGDAAAKLLWSSARQAKSAVPEERLHTLATAYTQQTPQVAASLVDSLATFNSQIIQTIGYGLPAEVDIFSVPPVINGFTTTIEEQQLAVHYRAAIETLSSMLHEMFLADQNISTDELLRRLARDLYSDGVIDGWDDPSQSIVDGIDVDTLSRDPMALGIANTQYRVRDIVSLIDEERAIVGTASNVVFLKDDIKVSLQPALLDPTVENPQEIDYSDPVGNTANTLLLTGLITSTPVGGEVQFYHDFEDENLKTYTQDDLREHWGTGTSSSVSSGSVKIVSDPDPSGSHGNVMRVYYAGNSYNFAKGSGAQWRTPVNGVHDDLYLAYDVFVTADAEFVKGGKLPGLMGGPKLLSGGKDVDGTDGWSGRLLWKENGTLQNYMYVANKPGTYGWKKRWDEGPEGQVNLKKGTWNRLEMRYVMNTPGVANGRLQAWFNGKLVLDDKDIMYRTPGGKNIGIDRIIFSTFYGGGSSEFAPSKDQYIYFDNFVVSTQPITH